MADTPPPLPPSKPPPQAPSYAEEVAELKEWQLRWQQATNVIMRDQGAKTVTVSDPEVIGTNVLTKYMVYTIRTEPFMYNVQRRYTDFVWLRQQLVAQYPGLLIPSLPPKKITATVGRDADSEMVRTRMNHLSLFMSYIVDLPFLVGNECIEAFLTKANGHEWDNSKKVLESGSDVANGTGNLEWAKLLEECAAPEDDMTIERIAVEVRTHIGILLANLESVEKYWGTTSGYGESFFKQMESMSGGVVSWKDFEVSLADPDSQNIINSLGEVMSASMLSLSSISEQWSIESMNLSDMVSLEFLGLLQTQIMLTEGMRDLLDSREITQKEINKVEQELVQLRQDRERLARKNDSFFDKMSGKTPGKVEASIQKREYLLEILQRNLSRMGRALWFCEVDRFGTERTRKLESTVKSVIEKNAARAEESAQKWVALRAGLQF